MGRNVEGWIAVETYYGAGNYAEICERKELKVEEPFGEEYEVAFGD